MNNLSNERASDSDIQQIIDSTEKGTTMFLQVGVYYLIAKELKALREAGKEPLMHLFKHPAGKLFWALTDESNKGRKDVIPVYAAPQLPAVPEGWVMVPKDPTMPMMDEFDSIIDYGAEDSKNAWSRLIAAAPKPEAAVKK